MTVTKSGRSSGWVVCRVFLRPGRRAAPGTPPRRAAPIAAAPRPLGRCRRAECAGVVGLDREQPTTATHHAPTTFGHHASRTGNRSAGRSHLPLASRRARRRRSTGPHREAHSHLSFDDVGVVTSRASTSSASASGSTSSIKAARTGPAMRRGRSSFDPPGPQRMEWLPGLWFPGDVCAGEHVGPAVRTRGRQWQPYVDRELRQAALALPRHRLPTFWNAAGRCAPSSRRALNAPPPFRVRRPSVPAASAATRGDRRDPAPAVGLARRDEARLEPLMEPLGRCLVGYRQDRRHRLGQSRRVASARRSRRRAAPP